MTAVRLRESAAYGARLYGYLLGVTLLGGAGVALGVTLARPAYRAWLRGGTVEPTTAAAGGVLLVLGASILLVGYLGAAYKLVADAVATGRADAAGRATTAGSTAETAPTQGESAHGADEDTAADPGGSGDAGGGSGPTQAPGIDPASTDPASTDPATTDDTAVTQPEAADETSAATDGVTGVDAVETESAAATGEDELAGEAYGSRRTEGPPEPTPEEIAFGTSGEDDLDDESGDGAGDGDDAGRQSTGSVRPAGRDAPSDPLADPTDDE